MRARPARELGLQRCRRPEHAYRVQRLARAEPEADVGGRGHRRRRVHLQPLAQAARAHLDLGAHAAAIAPRPASGTLTDRLRSPPSFSSTRSPAARGASTRSVSPSPSRSPAASSALARRAAASPSAAVVTSVQRPPRFRARAAPPGEHEVEQAVVVVVDERAAARPAAERARRVGEAVAALAERETSGPPSTPRKKSVHLSLLRSPRPRTRCGRVRRQARRPATSRNVPSRRLLEQRRRRRVGSERSIVAVVVVVGGHHRHAGRCPTEPRLLGDIGERALAVAPHEPCGRPASGGRARADEPGPGRRHGRRRRTPARPRGVGRAAEPGPLGDVGEPARAVVRWRPTPEASSSSKSDRPSLS